MDVDPCRAANDAERVTQKVTAITLINNKSPGGQVTKRNQKHLIKTQANFMILRILMHTYFVWATDYVKGRNELN